RPGARPGGGPGAGEPEAAGPGPGAEHLALVVVLLALLRRAEDRVRLGDLLEPVLRLLVARVGVGVIVASELAVGLLDLTGGRVLVHTEVLVEVLGHPVTAAHDITSLLRASSRASLLRGSVQPPLRTSLLCGLLL